MSLSVSHTETDVPSNRRKTQGRLEAEKKPHSNNKQKQAYSLFDCDMFCYCLFVCLFVCCFVCVVLFSLTYGRTRLLVLAVISFGQFWSKVTAVLPQYFFTGPLSCLALILPDILILIFIRYIDTVSDLIFVPNVSARHWSEDTKPQVITSDLTTGTWST